MSLDIDLVNPVEVMMPRRVPVRENGRVVYVPLSQWRKKHPFKGGPLYEQTRIVWTGNITHGLDRVAKACNLYKPIWTPGEEGIIVARDICSALAAGLLVLETRTEMFRQYEPTNNWGRVEDLISFVAEYLAACKAWPDAVIEVWP